jgi:hypothetical protein
MVACIFYNTSERGIHMSLIVLRKLERQWHITINHIPVAQIWLDAFDQVHRIVVYEQVPELYERAVLQLTYFHCLSFKKERPILVQGKKCGYYRHHALTPKDSDTYMDFDQITEEIRCMEREELLEALPPYVEVII